MCVCVCVYIYIDIDIYPAAISTWLTYEPAFMKVMRPTQKVRRIIAKVAWSLVKKATPMEITPLGTMPVGCKRLCVLKHVIYFNVCD